MSGFTALLALQFVAAAVLDHASVVPHPVPMAAAVPAPPPVVAVLDVALYTAGANLQEPSDTARAMLATGVLRRTLDSLIGPMLADSAAVRRQVRAAAAKLGGDRPCNVIVACARAVAEALGASYVVMAKVSKTSNLIWLLTGQLVEVGPGTILLDDTTELKGDPDVMVSAGVRIFAERVARAVKERGGEAGLTGR